MLVASDNSPYATLSSVLVPEARATLRLVRAYHKQNVGG